MARETLSQRVARLEVKDAQRDTEASGMRAAIDRLEARVFWIAVGGAGLGAAGGSGVAHLAAIFGGS
jgi:hypothetical protein